MEWSRQESSRERDTVFNEIIEQTDDVGLHSRRHLTHAASKFTVNALGARQGRCVLEHMELSGRARFNGWGRSMEEITPSTDLAFIQSSPTESVCFQYPQARSRHDRDSRRLVAAESQMWCVCVPLCVCVCVRVSVCACACVCPYVQTVQYTQIPSNV